MAYRCFMDLHESAPCLSPASSAPHWIGRRGNESACRPRCSGGAAPLPLRAKALRSEVAKSLTVPARALGQCRVFEMVARSLVHCRVLTRDDVDQAGPNPYARGRLL